MLGRAKIGRGNVWGPIFRRALWAGWARSGRTGARQPRVGEQPQGSQIIAGAASDAGRDPNSIELVFAHWIAIVRNAAERRAVRARRVSLDSFPVPTRRPVPPASSGSQVRSRNTFGPIPKALERIDGYLSTPINDDEVQRAILARDLRPTQAQSRWSTDKQRSVHVRR